MAGTAAYGIVARETLVVKENAAESRTRVRDWIYDGLTWSSQRRVIAKDVVGFRLPRIVRQSGQIDHAFIGKEERSWWQDEPDRERQGSSFHRGTGGATQHTGPLLRQTRAVVEGFLRPSAHQVRRSGCASVLKTTLLKSSRPGDAKSR